MSVEVIKRTPLLNVTVVTAKRTKPRLIRPFATFTITRPCRYAQHLTDFATQAAALHAHQQLVHRLKDGGL